MIASAVIEKKAEVAKPKSEAVDAMSKISTYNGDSCDKYDWSQSINEVTMQIPIPEGTSSKQIQIVIKAKHLYVALKGQEKPLIDGDL